MRRASSSGLISSSSLTGGCGASVTRRSFARRSVIVQHPGARFWMIPRIHLRWGYSPKDYGPGHSERRPGAPEARPVSLNEAQNPRRTVARRVAEAPMMGRQLSRARAVTRSCRGSDCQTLPYVTEDPPQLEQVGNLCPGPCRNHYAGERSDDGNGALAAALPAGRTGLRGSRTPPPGRPRPGRALRGRGGRLSGRPCPVGTPVGSVGTCIGLIRSSLPTCAANCPMMPTTVMVRPAPFHRYALAWEHD